MSSENTVSDYSWVTDEMFDEMLDKLVEEMSPDELFCIPGIYEILREELNNKVLEELETLHS